jgi:hypothetical protein
VRSIPLLRIDRSIQYFQISRRLVLQLPHALRGRARKPDLEQRASSLMAESIPERDRFWPQRMMARGRHPVSAMDAAVCPRSEQSSRGCQRLVSLEVVAGVVGEASSSVRRRVAAAPQLPGTIRDAQENAFTFRPERWTNYQS